MHAFESLHFFSKRGSIPREIGSSLSGFDVCGVSDAFHEDVGALERCDWGISQGFGVVLEKSFWVLHFVRNSRPRQTMDL